ncbi:MAG TPA: hydroxyacylglutathione hydrolase C-terminal domain-containing protein [Steroidobacteraceae bacterium]|nr:hydroxyacylglutathione hydrolase C-terminal domain-containing protein [Steroidobacteraceae bacterium]
MRIERIWAANSLRNFHYLIACEETGEALIVDPLDAAQCLAAARASGLQITQVLNTHEHRDHTDGNAGVVAETHAKVLAHAGAARTIGGVDRGLMRGDIVRIGHTVELEVLDTPGHTRSHVCLLAHGESPALFCGDTLFNAGAGNCHNGGDAGLLYETFVNQLARLPDTTRVYPGHEYMARNLAFTMDREPGNAEAAKALAAAKDHDPAKARVTTLGEEKRVNAFLRLQNPELIALLRERFPEIGERPEAHSVFTKLRELRNRW